MKKLTIIFITIFLMFFSFEITYSQTKNKVEVKRIDLYVKTVNKFIKNKKPHLVFADTSDYEAESKSKWQKFKSADALEKFRTRNETYIIAYNWLQNGKIVQSSFTLFSPSGDWAHYVTHYFRADGTLAKVESDYRTFMGDFIILENLYFDKRGKNIKKTVAYKDLRTGKPKQPSKDDLQGDLPLINETDYYKKTSKLPFANLLRKKK